jgi:hypothetical protein
MFLDFIELKTVYLIGHIFGAILGAGGAFASDAMFFSTIKDGRINKDELRFMKLGSKLVWSGLALLVVSGIFLVYTNPEMYFASSKFLAKLTIVGVIVVNGIIFHLIHLPHIQGHIGLKFADSPTFKRKASFLMASGAISMVSWILTVILGVLKNIPYNYTQIIGTYFILIIFVIIGAVVMKKRILHLN